MSQRVSAGHGQAVSKNSPSTIQREGYYREVPVHKTLISKMNAHLSAQWCKNQKHWSTEMWEKKSDESSSFIVCPQQVHVWCIQREQCTCECLTPTVRAGSLVLSEAFVLACFWSTCPLRGKDHCKSIQ